VFDTSSFNMDLMKVMESITLLVTVGMFMTGLSPCLKMYKTKSTKNVPFPIFLMSAVSCLGMFHYGIMMGNPILVFLNSIGAVMQSLYVSLYLMIVKSKTKPLFFLLLAVIYDIALYSYIYTALHVESERADKIGMCSSLITTCIMCLPALEVVQNVRQKNADGMPLIMLVGGMCCSSCWLIYGMMLGDPNIYTPNIPGLMIGSAKISMIILYGGNSKEEIKKD